MASSSRANEVESRVKFTGVTHRLGTNKTALINTPLNREGKDLVFGLVLLFVTSFMQKLLDYMTQKKSHYILANVH